MLGVEDLLEELSLEVEALLEELLLDVDTPTEELPLDADEFPETFGLEIAIFELLETSLEEPVPDAPLPSVLSGINITASMIAAISKTLMPITINKFFF